MRKSIAAAIVGLSLLSAPPGAVGGGEAGLDIVFDYAGATAQLLFTPLKHAARYVPAIEVNSEVHSLGNAKRQKRVLQVRVDAAYPAPAAYRGVIPANSPFTRFDDTVDYVLRESHRLVEQGTAGLSYDARERLWPASPAQREFVAFWSRRVDRDWKTQLYLLKGMAEGSPSWGAGAFAVYSF